MRSLHQAYNFFDGRLLVDRHNLARHHILDPAATGANILIGAPARTKKKFQPARASPISGVFNAAQKVSFSDHSNQAPGVVHDRQTADCILQHSLRRFRQQRVTADRRRPKSHDVRCFHEIPPRTDGKSKLTHLVSRT
jgi:hypothetical protein